MLLRSIIVVFLFVSLSTSCLAFGAPPKKAPKTENSSIAIIIDNFEDGTLQEDPEWWIFDKISLSSSRSNAKGALCLEVKGKTNDWYVGGLGTYIAKPERDFSAFSSIEMDIYGYGPNSGKIKIELYEDDNGNWQIEQNPKKGYVPVFDDRFSYELDITWDGWKTVKIPLSDFVDNNPKAGDNIWNPQKIGKSGGLAQIQIIVLANSKAGSVHFLLDNLRFSSK